MLALAHCFWPRFVCLVCFIVRYAASHFAILTHFYSIYFHAINTQAGGRGRAAGMTRDPKLFKATAATTRGQSQHAYTMASKRRLFLLQLVVIPMASCLAFATGHLPSSSLLHARGQGLSMVRGSPSYGIGARADGGLSSSSSVPRKGSFYLPTRRTQSRLHSSRADEQVHFCVCFFGLQYCAYVCVPFFF